MKRNHSERGGVLAGILVAFLILAALAVAGVFMAGMYLADNIHVQKTRTTKGETVQVETPIGSMRVQQYQKLDPKVIGVPVYPRGRAPGRERRCQHRLQLRFGAQRVHHSGRAILDQ